MKRWEIMSAATAGATALALGVAACGGNSGAPDKKPAATAKASPAYESQFWYETAYDPAHHIVEEIPQGAQAGSLSQVLQFCVGKELLTVTMHDTSYNQGISADSKPNFPGCLLDQVLTPDDLGITNYTTLTN